MGPSPGWSWRTAATTLHGAEPARAASTPELTDLLAFKTAYEERWIQEGRSDALRAAAPAGRRSTPSSSRGRSACCRGRRAGRGRASRGRPGSGRRSPAVARGRSARPAGEGGGRRERAISAGKPAGQTRRARTWRDALDLYPACGLCVRPRAPREEARINAWIPTYRGARHPKQGVANGGLHSRGVRRPASVVHRHRDGPSRGPATLHSRLSQEGARGLPPQPCDQVHPRGRPFDRAP